MTKLVKAGTKTLTTYSRANQINVYNPLPNEGVPSISFQEFTIQVDEEGKESVASQDRVLSEVFNAESQETTFDLFHPVTEQFLGSAKYSELQVMLSSLYYHLVNEEEAREIEAKAIAAEAERILQEEKDLMNQQNPAEY